MNSTSQRVLPTQDSVIASVWSRSRTAAFVIVFAVLACLSTQPLRAADEPGLAQKAEDAARQKTSEAVEKAKDFWQQIDAARLKNRTPDQIVAWVIMGVLVASVVGMMTSLKPTGAGLIGRLLLGLAGAFLGSVAIRIRDVDFGWGPVLIRYEELLFSFVGALVLVLLPRIIRWKFKKAAFKK